MLALSLWAAAAVIIAINPTLTQVFGTLLVAGLFVLLLAVLSGDSVGKVPPGLYRHVLKEDLQMGEFSELGGVEYVMLPFPDRARIGDPLVLLFILQNAYTEPRAFRLAIGRGVLEPAEPPPPVVLGGGECGALIVGVRAKPGTKPGEYSVHFRPRVRSPGSAGTRIFPPPKAMFTITARQFQAIHTLTDGAGSGPAVPVPPSSYRVVFRPGMSAPDTTALDFLNAKPG
jgi:hypothetical protein